MADEKTTKTTEKAETKEVKKTKKPAAKDLKSLKLELRNLLLDIRTGKENNTSKVKAIKKQIAQLLTQKRLENISK